MTLREWRIPYVHYLQTPICFYIFNESAGDLFQF